MPAAGTANPLDQLLPGDILLESWSPDDLLQEQRIAYGAHFTHASVYVGVRDGDHVVVEALSPGKISTTTAIEDKYFNETYNDHQIVRVKAATDEQRQLVADFAEGSFVGVPYAWGEPDQMGLAIYYWAVRSGLDKNRVTSLYCSSLVWNAWRAVGVDLDSDFVGGVGTVFPLLWLHRPYFVMPDDIAFSDKVEFVDLPMPQAPSIEVYSPVPSVVGKPESAARKTLRAAGFRTKVTVQYDDSAGKGTVIEQNPAVGYAASGSRVGLTVSRGPELVRVPDARRFIGSYSGGASSRQLRDLRAAIINGFGNVGLVAHVEFLSAYEWAFESGDDLCQGPSPGSMVPKGSRVYVEVLLYD